MLMKRLRPNEVFHLNTGGTIKNIGQYPVRLAIDTNPQPKEQNVSSDQGEKTNETK